MANVTSLIELSFQKQTNVILTGLNILSESSKEVNECSNSSSVYSTVTDSDKHLLTETNTALKLGENVLEDDNLDKDLDETLNKLIKLSQQGKLEEHISFLNFDGELQTDSEEVDGVDNNIIVSPTLQKKSEVNCEHCKRYFPSTRSLTFHIKKSHPQQYEQRHIFMCDQCRVSFLTKYNLRRHMKNKICQKSEEYVEKRKF